MIGFAMLGTNDLARAQTFYDPLMALLGAAEIEAWRSEGRIWYGVGGAPPLLALTRPHDGQPATVGNGVMLALVAASHDAVRAVHARALALGATDEGGPGFRGDAPDGLFRGYFRDLDGNKLMVFRIGSD